MINLASKSSRVRILAGATVFILLAVGLYQSFSTKSISRTPQASTTSKPTTKPTPVKVTPTPVKATPVKVTPKPTPVKVTPKPTVKPTPKPTVKPTTKPVTPVKFGNNLPINDIYPFPIVGKQIEAGYYYNSKGPCSIGVYDSKGQEIFEENTKEGAQSIIYLKNGDQVQNLCPLTKGLPTSITSSIPTGMHIINGDLKPGIYTTSNNCFYWVTKGKSASEYTRGITNNNDQRFSSTAGIAFTLGNVDEAVFFHSGCGVINKVG